MTGWMPTTHQPEDLTRDLHMAPRERSHATVGPSTLGRALRCPGSVNFIEALDDVDTSGDAADEGTILHSFAEDCLNKDISPFSMVGEQRTYNGYTYELTDDDAEGIQQGLDVIDDIPGKLLVEKRVTLDRWMPNQFGTCDIAVIGKKRIVVADWKFGFKAVSPVENPQLMAYALGMWDNFARHETKATEFRLIIFQPRAPAGGGEWDVSLDDLLAFGDRLKKLSKTVADPKAPRCAGNWCDDAYCPGAKTRTCPEYDKFNLDMIVRDFEELDDDIEHDLPLRLPRGSAISPERRSHLLKHRGMITKWLDRLHAETLDDALKGLPTPGLKAVEGRSPPRRWSDKDDAEKALLRALPEEEVYTRRVITPTQAEKLLSETAYGKLSALINKGERKPSLVPVEDARPALRNIADEFNDEEEDD